MILIVDDNKEIRESLSEYPLQNNKLECNILKPLQYYIQVHYL